MSHLRTLIEELCRRKDLAVDDQNQAWLLRIPRADESICEITVPREVLEWFASVKRGKDQKEVWSDWMDYCSYEKSSKEKLEAEMADHISAFIARVTTTEAHLPLRIYEETPNQQE